MNMANKFLIEGLLSANIPFSSNSLAVVETASVSYKVNMQDIYQDVLSNRLVLSAEDDNPSLISVMFRDDNNEYLLL